MKCLLGMIWPLWCSGIGERRSAGCQYAGVPAPSLSAVLQEDSAQKEEGERKQCQNLSENQRHRCTRGVRVKRNKGQNKDWISSETHMQWWSHNIVPLSITDLFNLYMSNSMDERRIERRKQWKATRVFLLRHFTLTYKPWHLILANVWQKC